MAFPSVEDPAEEVVEEEPEVPEGLDPITTEPPFDLTDVPPYPPPAGFEVLSTWNDGDNVMRGTIYAATNGAPNALIAPGTRPEPTEHEEHEVPDTFVADAVEHEVPDTFVADAVI